MSQLAIYNLRSDQERFLENYLLTGDVDAAARDAGRKVATCRSWLRDTKIQNVVSRELKQRLDSGAIGALNVLSELATSAADPKLRLQAARDILDRAGYKPEHLHTTADRRMEGANMSELLDRIKELQSELGMGAQQVVQGEAREVQDAEIVAPPTPPTPDDATDPPEPARYEGPDESQWGLVDPATRSYGVEGGETTSNVDELSVEDLF